MRKKLKQNKKHTCCYCRFAKDPSQAHHVGMVIRICRTTIVMNCAGHKDTIEIERDNLNIVARLEIENSRTFKDLINF